MVNDPIDRVRPYDPADGLHSPAYDDVVYRARLATLERTGLRATHGRAVETVSSDWSEWSGSLEPGVVGPDRQHGGRDRDRSRLSLLALVAAVGLAMAGVGGLFRVLGDESSEMESAPAHYPGDPGYEEPPPPGEDPQSDQSATGPVVDETTGDETAGENPSGDAPPTDQPGDAEGHQHGDGGHDHAPPVDATTGPSIDGPTTRVVTAADQAALRGGFTVPAGEVWEFDPQSDVVLQVEANVVVNGVLRLRPASPDVEHVLQFVDVNESDFQGGGMDVLASDVGLWVMGAGQLDVQGAARTGWTNLADGASAGATTIELASPPVGWRAGDEIAISPTVAPTVDGHDSQFDERRIVAIDGATVQLDRPLDHDHPRINGQWTAEVMNLTRNVRIEGTGQNSPDPGSNGRAHILIRSNQPQHLRHAQIRHMGPREPDGQFTDGVLGRYSLHFHHSMDGSRGTLIEGVVIRNSGNHGFVPHASNGITMVDNVAYDGWEHAMWWDPQEGESTANNSHDIVIDRMLVAGLQDDPEFRGYRLAAFALAGGTNLSVTNSVAVGVQGNGNGSASGFRWLKTSVWTFADNVAHNNRADGLFAWQNNSNPHLIRGFVAYHNGGDGIEHGAYRNSFQFQDLTLFGNGNSAVALHSSAAGDSQVQRSDGYTQSFVGLETDGRLQLLSSALDATRPTLFRDCGFTEVQIKNRAREDDRIVAYDFVDCGLEPDDFEFIDVAPTTVIRVQNGSSAFQLDADGRVSTIQPFYD